MLNNVQEEIGNLSDKAAQFIRHEVERTMLAGNILPVLDKLFLTPDELKRIGKSLLKVLEWKDLLFLLFVGYATLPFMRIPYEASKSPGRVPFHRTWRFHIGESVSQLAQISLLVYCFDLLKVIVLEMGFTHVMATEVSHVVGKTAYILWASTRISALKKFLLYRVWGRNPDRIGRKATINRLGDALVLIITGFILMDIFSVELGIAVKSMFGLASVSTLMVSLASQGLWSQVLNGLMLNASDRLYEGEQVVFGNGVKGTVVKLGWMETIFRGNDEVMVAVPNSDLAAQKISNLSRLKKCQVVQSLRFSYADVEKLPKLCNDIKKEIKLNCPQLIVDGTRPFRVYWRGYESGHLEVKVDTHFNIRPIGDAYYENRERVLQAIYRSVKKNDINFKT